MPQHLHRVVHRRGYRGGRPTRQMGVNHLGEVFLPVVPALSVVPPACPWCKNPCLRYYDDAPTVNCALCGWEGLMAPPQTAHGPAWR